MSQVIEDKTGSLHGVGGTALEAARAEVVRRLEQLKMPLSISIREVQIIDNDNGGWQSQWVTTQVSSLRDINIQFMVRDDSVQSRLHGLRQQLEPLANLLNETTDLGTRPANLLPDMTGVEAILTRYVTSLAYQYLDNLPDLSKGDARLIDRLVKELEELVTPEVVKNTSQLAIEGVRVNAPLEYRAVKLRPLSPTERGQYWESRNSDLLSLKRRSGRFVIPRDFVRVIPSALLEVTTSRPRTEQFSQSTFMNRVALAFYLHGCDIASTGMIVTFDEPTWATFGQSHQRFLVDEKRISGSRLVDKTNFKRVVDLAYQMPDFGPGESSSREIALYRMLRGLGVNWQESGFLDLMIALEAVLLQGFNSELSYRFALYGALFLGGSNSQQTFAKLRNIYEVRSKLVHGTAVSPTKRQQALEDASEIARAIFLKSSKQGWPDKDVLDRLAFKAAK